MTATAVRQAIDRVSQWADDVAGDRAAADQVLAAVRPLPRAELFEVLAAAGLEGIRRHDPKAHLLRRLVLRLTGRVRARERAEV